MSSQALSKPNVDLLADTWADGIPHEELAWLRKNDPVHWHQGPDADEGFWCVTKYEDVWRISRDIETFSVELGSAFIETHDEESLEIMRMTLLNMDPPKHSRYRKLVSAGFTPRMIRMLREKIDERARLIVDGVAHRGECEFVEDIAAELPLQVICEMIGVPEDDRHLIFEWTNALVGFDDPDYRATEEDGELAMAQMYAYCDNVAARRREDPRDDIMTTLVNAEVDGDRLSDVELDMFFVILAVAGNETTRNLIAHAMLAIIEHPEARRELVEGIDDDALWTRATEEFLRWGTSIINFRRTATRDTEIRGIPIKANDKVVLYYISANRDEDVFEDPFVFDIHRDPNEHLTFGGGGVHYCLGANLARAEITAITRELLRRMPDIELAGPVDRLRSNFINGIKRMPVRWGSSDLS